MTKTTPGNFFEDFRLGQTIRARDAAHRDGRRRRALQRAVRRALRAAVVRPVRLCDRLSGFAGRRSARVPHRVRQDRAGHLAQRGRQPRLCGLPLPARGLSGRHAHRGLGSHRPEGELEPQDRRRLCALDRLQAGRHQGARLCALGDGAQARRGGGRAGRSRSGPAQGGRARRARRGLPDGGRAPLRLRARRQRRTASATIRSARRSTTWTA